MSSPATPETGRRGIRVGNGVRIMPESTRVRQRVAPIEPSPASTYGETAPGNSSGPLTPQDVEAQNANINVGRSAHQPLNLTALLRTGAKNGNRALVNGPSGDPQLPGRDQFGGSTASVPTNSGRNTDGEYAEDRDDDQSRDGFDANGSPRSHRASNSWSHLSPAGHLRHQSGVELTQAGPSPRFVLHSQESIENDPFVEPFTFSDRETSVRRGTGTSSHHGYVTSSGDSSESDEADEPTVGTVAVQSNEERAVTRPDRSGQEISAENAQAFLPASACVFVANLALVRTDEQLERSVKAVFQEYGTVFVKIRRDGRNMPYAFCQYTNDEDAQRAIVNGRRQVIDGRQCRTEPARVNRSVYVSRVTGGPVSEAAVCEALSRHGEIESSWFSSETEKEMYQLPQGIWVRFRYYDHCREALTAFRNHDEYRLEQPPNATDLKSRAPAVRAFGPRQAPSIRQRFVPIPSRFTAVASRVTFYRRSIFIGNLTPTTENRIREVCAEYGRVLNVEVFVKPIVQRHGCNTYAFVEFAHEEEATRAIYRLSQGGFDGHAVRVEPRESPEHRGHRVPQVGMISAQRFAVQHERAASFQRTIERAPVGDSTQTRVVPGTVVPPHLYRNSVQEFASTPHLPVTAAVATPPSTAVVQYSSPAQPHPDNEQTSGTTPSVQHFAQAGYPHPAYYLHGNGPSASVGQMSAQAANWYQAYHQYHNYAQYWPVGYYPYPAQYGAPNNGSAPVAALAALSMNNTESLPMTDGSGAEHGQELSGSPGPD